MDLDTDSWFGGRGRTVDGAPHCPTHETCKNCSVADQVQGAVDASARILKYLNRDGIPLGVISKPKMRSMANK